MEAVCQNRSPKKASRRPSTPRARGGLCALLLALILFRRPPPMEHNSTSWLLPGMRAAGERPISRVPPPPGERCAVCFAGLDKQEPYQAGRNIRENLIDRLGADVLLALTQLIKEDEKVAKEERIAKAVAGIVHTAGT